MSIPSQMALLYQEADLVFTCSYSDLLIHGVLLPLYSLNGLLVLWVKAIYLLHNGLHHWPHLRSKEEDGEHVCPIDSALGLAADFLMSPQWLLERSHGCSG